MKNLPGILTEYIIKNSENFKQKIPKPQKADIFIPQIVGFHQKQISEFFAGFFDFAFYISYGWNYLFGGMPSPNVGGPLSVIRVFDLRDIKIKVEACNLHCGMMNLLHNRGDAGLVLHGK